MKTGILEDRSVTSNPARVAANRLYQDMGFERYETNCYKMEIARAMGG